MPIDFRPIPVTVINSYGRVETFQSKFMTCKHLNIYMTSLNSFLRSGNVTRGRFKGWSFSIKN